MVNKVSGPAIRPAQNSDDLLEVNLPADLPEIGLPDFSFLGTDGETYIIGQTPHSFVGKLKQEGFNPANLTDAFLDEWLWIHLKVVANQRHLTLEEVHQLYFEVDIEHIVDCLCQRFIEGQWSMAKGLVVIEKRLTELLSKIQEVRAGAEETSGDVNSGEHSSAD